MLQDCSAQSEVIGVAFLTGIIVLLVGFVGVSVLGTLDTATEPTTNLDTNVTSATVQLTHHGGDSLAVSKTEVIFTDGSTSRFDLADFTEVQGDGDGRFEAGEARRHGHSKSETIRVLVVHHGETESVVLDTTADVPQTRAPTASFTVSPSSPTTGDTVTVDATASSDPDGTVVSYDWAFGDGTTATGGTATHSYADDGTYTVTLTVTDDDGATATATKSLTVSNRGPTARIAYSPTDPDTGDTITFDGTGSSDPDGSIASYQWDFGDGTTATGPTPTHTYADDGTYTVTLTVVDDDGTSKTTTTSVQVDNVGPTAAFTSSPSDPSTSDTVSFDASGSSDPDGTIASYDWDFGDGTTASGGTTTHSYADDGTYTVTLTVTDDDGATNSTTATVQVDNVPPSVAFETRLEDADGDGQDEIVYDATASGDSDGSITRYQWDIDGDGAVEIDTTNPVATEESLFVTTGNVTLTVTDDDGATVSRTQSGEYQPTPGFEVFGVVLAVLLGGELRRRGYL